MTGWGSEQTAYEMETPEEDEDEYSLRMGKMKNKLITKKEDCDHHFEIIDDQVISETSICNILFKRKEYFSRIRTLSCKKCGILINHRTYLGENFTTNKPFPWKTK